MTESGHQSFLRDIQWSTEVYSRQYSCPPVHLYTCTPVLYTHRPAQPVHNIQHANYYAIVLRRVEFQRYLKYAEIWKYAQEKNHILKHFIESITLLRNS